MVRRGCPWENLALHIDIEPHRDAKISHLRTRDLPKGDAIERIRTIEAHEATFHRCTRRHGGEQLSVTVGNELDAIR